jgi:hypothetical protein
MIKITQLISLLMIAATCLIPAQGLQLQGAVWEAFPSPGDSLQYAMKVNLSQEESPTLITASVMNCSQDGQGTLLEESSSSSLSPPSAQPWISLRLSNQSSQESSKTLSFTLQPGESREIIASAQIPQEESLKGGRYALIKFLSSPQQVSRHKIGQIQTQVATEAFVSFDLGYETFAAEIPELSYADGNLSMQIDNTGNMHFKPRIVIEAGSIKKELSANDQPSILPGFSRLIKLPLGLEPGSHEIKAQVFREEGLLAEKQISAEA